MNKLFQVFITLLILGLTGCSTGKKGLRVVATPIPQGDLLEFVKPELKKEGINLIVITTDDYNTPNRALAEGDVDANFFQHAPFLQAQIRHFGYQIRPIATIEYGPMGIYSNKYKSISDLPDNGVISVPNDPTNEARALKLLQTQGLIQLDSASDTATVLNISYNPKNLSFIEVDAAMTPRTLWDTDAAVINANFALEFGLNPLKDPIVIEKGDEQLYANLIVIRDGEQNRPDIQALKKVMTSESMRRHIETKYKGAIIPAF